MKLERFPTLALTTSQASVDIKHLDIANINRQGNKKQLTSLRWVCQALGLKPPLAHVGNKQLGSLPSLLRHNSVLGPSRK